MIFYHQYEISDRLNTIMPYFNFWDFGRIMAVGQRSLEAQNYDS
jgi:hypothetical protein